MARLQIKLHDDRGNLLAVFPEAALNHLSMTVTENEIGELVITMPQSYVDWELVNQPDRILTVERDVGAGFYPECGAGAERGFFLRDVEFSTDENNNEYVTLYAYDGNYLLDSRIVAYTAEGSYTKRTDNTDDMPLLIVHENLGTACTDTARIQAGLSVENGRGDGPYITKSYARSNVLSTIKGIASESWQQGTYMIFDTVYIAPGQFEFRTYIGWRGVNMGSTGTTKCTLYPHPAKLRYSRKNERNYIYAGGQGAKDGRSIQTATNDGWAKASRWNRREMFVSANGTSDAAAVLSAAQNALYQNRPRWVIEGTIKDIDGQRYGVDYHWGDIVIAVKNGISLDCHVSAVNIVYDAGRETVNVSLRSEI